MPNCFGNFLYGGENTPKEKLEKSENIGSNKMSMDSGSGDFDYENTSSVVSSNDTSTSESNNCMEIPLEKCLHKQLHNTKTLVTTLENEIAESKEDVHYLHSQIFSAERVFPKLWEMCQDLKDDCKQQVETISSEMQKWRRKTERFDIEVRELEQRIGSWQCLIDNAKEAQVREVEFLD